MDEVCDSKKYSIIEAKPHHKRRIVLPLEGKGDRSAVDEVTCTPAPLREAFAPKLKTAGSRKCDARYAQSRSLFGALRPSPRRRRGTAIAVDEVCDSPERPTFAVKPHIISGALSFPLRGRGTAPRWMR